MQKNELVHLHSLLSLLREHFEEEELIDPDAFEEYESLGVSPSQAYKRKGDHRRALLALSEILADELAARGKYCSSSEQLETAHPDT